MSAAPGELDPVVVERIRRVADFPTELLDYMSWLRHSSPSPVSDDYLFEKPSVRFEPRAEDVLIADPTLRVEGRGKTTLLVSARASVPLSVTGVSPATARHLLADFDGRRPLLEIRARWRSERREFDQLLTQAFGKMLFAPFALQGLERAVSGAEISRFPGSPYEIARPYWSNMASIRGQLDEFDAWLVDTQEFVAKLQELHVVALMGADLQTFYRPRSPISERRAAPGQLMHTPTRHVPSADAVLFLSGPRVNASFIGGRTYHELLYASLDEPAAAELRAHTDPHGTPWGRLVHGRSETDAQAGDWFCPPRPFEPAHFDALRTTLLGAVQAAERHDATESIAGLARFHQTFIRLHPFHCANQCLAMSIVNGVLRRVSGAGIPHLMLDHLAFRLSSEAYARVFARAVDAYAEPATDAAQRYHSLAQKRALAFELLHELSGCNGMLLGRRSVEAAGDAARLLLLRPLPLELHTPRVTD